jgi:phenylalanyl-tRNA synthetase beta chain
MKVVYNWLKDFVGVTATVQELAARLALHGTNVASVESQPLGGVIDAEITSNRPDCLGVYGIAREVAAIYKLELKRIAPKPAESSSAKASEVVSVKIEAPEICGRFTARVIRNVKIQPAPTWLRERLQAAGVASINNVVDATNYVMLELGHALHAFDYDLVRNHSILVRAARRGEKIKTLDGIERELDPAICLISDGDGSRAVGIGGIMGGGETEISFSTTNVLIECAWFEPIAIRRATRFLKLHTEASTRFSRGADPEMAELASRRCAELILQLAGGELLGGVVDVYPGRRAPKKITLTRAEILRVMGADVADREVESILGALGFAPVRVDQNRGQLGSILAAWECTQPSWRADVEREIDLIEEVARIYGLNKFPPRLPAARQGAARLPQYEAESRLRERLIGLGYREIVTIPHVAEDRDILFRPDGVIPARLANPLSEEANILRSNGSVSMAAAIEWNLNHSQRNVRLFEIGRHYRFAPQNKTGETSLAPLETVFLTLGATGEAREKSIYENARIYEFTDLKGDLDALGSLTGGFNWKHDEPKWLNPSHAAHLSVPQNSRNTEMVGLAGQLSRRIRDRLKLRQDVFIAELELEPLYRSYYDLKNSRRFEPIPKLPTVERDFSLIFKDSGVTFGQIAGAIYHLNIPEVVSVQALDLYRGKNIPPGTFSLMIRVTLQSREGTLTDAEIVEISSRVLRPLQYTWGAQLRSS